MPVVFLSFITMPPMNIAVFLITALAVWRITHLLAKEDGPFHIIYSLRKKAGKSFWGKLLDCFYCCSIWTAFPFALWIASGWANILIHWLALSGAACLLEQATAPKSNSHDDIPEYTED